MDVQHDNREAQGLSRRDLLKAALAAGMAVSAWPLYDPPTLWGSGDTQARWHPAGAGFDRTLIPILRPRTLRRAP